MRIILANSLFPPLGIGGSEQSTYNLAKGLARRGHDIIVFTQNIDDKTIYEKGEGFRIVRIASRPDRGPNIFDSPRYTRDIARSKYVNHNPVEALEKIFSRYTPHVLHTSVILSVQKLWQLARQKGILSVHTLRNHSLICDRHMLLAHDLCMRQCRRCDQLKAPLASGPMPNAVVGISRYILNRYLQAGWFRNSPLRGVIANSFDTPVEVTIDTNSPPYTFGYIGRLHRIKGVDIFLDAVQRYRKLSGNRVPALVAGTGEASYVRYLKNNYEDADTSFIGHTAPEIFFAQVRYCVVPSIIYEPFGRTFIESFAFGVPVLGSRRGGGSEIVRHGETGWLFEPEIPAFIDIFRQAEAVDTAAYRTMRENALFDSRMYTNDMIAKAYERFYFKAFEKACS